MFRKDSFPFPMSIKFYCFSKHSNEPSLSGYCQKLETFLRAAGYTNYTLQFTAPMFAPKGKLPYIELEQDGTTKTIADSHFIIQYLISSEIVPNPDLGLTPMQKADSRAWQTWTEELAYPAIVHTRWARPTNYVMVEHQLSVPSLLRPFVAWYLRRNILNSLWGHGVGRHTDSEVDQILREYVQGLEARLAQTDYFHGSVPTLVDIIVYAFLANAIAGDANPEYRNMILASQRLKKYTADLTGKWFPEYENLLEVVM